MREQKNNSKEKRFLKNLFSFMKENTEKGDTFLLAISGGPDSMVLLDLFLTLRQITPISFCIANIDHGLREASSNEQEWLCTYCEKKDVTFYSQKVDIKGLKRSLGAKKSPEQLARDERHRILREIKQDCGARWIVTAHHKDDLLETFFLRLLRGTGLNGINTMNKVDGVMLRPLLDYFKEELLNYAKENGLFYFEDHTNWDTRFLRNRIRHRLIPFILKEFGEGVRDVLVRDVENLKTADRVFSQMFRDDIQKAEFSKKSVVIHQKHIQERSLSYLYEFFLRLYQQWHQSPAGLTGQKLDNICRRFVESGDFEITITDQIRFLRSNELTGFERCEKKEEKERKSIIFLREGFKNALEKNHVITLGLNVFSSKKNARFILETGSLKKDFKTGHSINIACIDYDTIHFPMMIRLWKEGDRIKPLGMSCYKKVSRLMTDQGIKKYKKRNQLILENGKHDIIWCMGIRISEDYKVTPSTVKCLKIIYNDSNEQDFEGRER